MDTYHVVLYIHLLALFVGIGAGGVMLTCLIQLRNAQTLEAAVPWGVVAGKTERLFPIAILGLFGTGAYMTSDVWSWSTSWIWVGIAGLVLLALQGPLLGGRMAKKLERSLYANGPGPLGAEAQRLARHPGLWITDLANLGVVLGIVWNMTEKPGTAASIAAVVVGYLVGAALAWPLSRAPETQAERAVEAST